MAKVEEYDEHGNLVPEQPDKPETETREDIDQPDPQTQEHGDEDPKPEGEDDPAAVKPSDTDTIRKMREHFKEIRAEKIRLQNENAALKGQQAKGQGELVEPTLESCGFDAGKYREAMRAYTKEVIKREEAAEAQKKEQEQLNAEWQESLRTFETRKKQIQGFADAELAVDATLTPMQKGLIVSAANDAAKLMFELGNDDDLLRELSRIKDLGKFAAKIGELNARSRRTSTVPRPESRIDAPSAATALASTTDKKLAALREEADRTNDFTKVNAYKRALKNGK